MDKRLEIEIRFKAYVEQVKNSLEKLGSSINGLSRELSDLGSISKMVAATIIGDLAIDALDTLQNSLTQASASFIDLESTLVRITAAMGVTGDEAARLREEFLEVAKRQTDLGYTAGEAAQALESLVKAGLEGEQAVKALRAALEMARIEGISTEQAANLLVATLNQFGMSAEDAGRALDVLINASMLGIDAASDFATGLSYVGTIAHQMGLSLEETTAALVAMNNAGLAAESAGRYLAAMLTDMINKSDKLGFSIYDADGKMRSLNEIIQLLRIHLESFGTQAERDAYLTEIFGSQGRRAAAVLLQMSGEFADLTAAMAQEGSANQMVNEIMNTTAGRLAKVHAESANASLGFGQLTAGVQEAFASFTTFLGPLAQVAQGLGPSLLQGAITGVTMALPQLISNIGGVSAAFSAMSGLISTSIIPLLTNPLTLAIAGVGVAVAGLYMAWQNNWFGIRDITAGVVDTLLNAWNNFTSWLTEAADGGISWFQDNWMIFFGPAGILYKAWEENWLGIRDFTDGVVRELENMFSGFMDYLGDVWDGIASSAQSAWDGLVNTITNAFNSITSKTDAAVNQVNSKMLSMRRNMVNVGNTAVETGNKVASLGKNISNLPDKTVTVKAVDEASSVIRSVKSELDKVKSKTVTIRIRKLTYTATKSGGGGGALSTSEYIKSMQTGGWVPWTGLYLLHAGEYVVPRSRPAINVNLNVSGYVGDPYELARILSSELARRLRRFER